MALVVAGASYVRGRVAHGVLHLAAARRARRRTARETLVKRQAEAPLHDDAHRPRRHPKLGPHGDGVEHVARVRLALKVMIAAVLTPGMSDADNSIALCSS